MSAWGSAFGRAGRVPRWFSAIATVILIGLTLWVRWSTPRHIILPVGFGVPLVIVGLFRSRPLLWFMVLVFAVSTVVLFAPLSGGWAWGGMVLIDLLLVGAVIDLWIATRAGVERRNIELENANADLSAREEEIARQNEELQSQTEELERQSEELRGVNEELAHREKSLEILLSLSRSMNTELSASDVMDRICETLGLLINGPGTAAAILERTGDRVTVRCHHGFGPAGLREESRIEREAFHSLVLGRDRTGYIEDLSLRPDLWVPQPAEGEPIVAVLGTPLRAGGEAIGTLEVYSRRKTDWSDEQISLVESLAAQASVSLKAARLFETIVEERNRFEAVLQTVPIGISFCNADLSDARQNPAGSAMLNLPNDRNVGVHFREGGWNAWRDGRRMAPEEYPLVQAVRHGRETHAAELEIVPPGRNPVNLLINARPIREPDGKIRGAVAAFVDITAQKELQRELDVRRREAEEASIRKTRFLAAVSHDIRTPANAISLLAELIRRTAGNPAMAGEVPELAQELQSSAISLVNLLSDVLDIARFDSDRIELQETEFPLTATLEDERRHLSPLAREKNLTIRVDPPAEPIILRTDRIKLGRVLGNLIGNAIKFTERGEVRIGADRLPDGLVRITVSDTGIGIAQEHLSHIFDEFFQLRNPERDRTKGTGLGLTICRRLVDAMGGRLEVRSAPGEGSTFTVTLPSFAVAPGPSRA